MITILFESHGTTTDNETDISSGHFDAPLSERGEAEARQLGERYREQAVAAVYCSDLQRSYKTAQIAFSGRGVPIIQDERLRECDYGELTRHPSAEVSSKKLECVVHPFPGGQSYQQTTKMMRDFLQEVKKKYHAGKIIVIGHRATQYGLENIINGVPLEKAVAAPWTWQPGWTYELTNV